MDEACPTCGNERYLNPQMKILVSPCYHRMCDACVDRLFSSGSAPCPSCSTVLRKANFATQTFENLAVEKECRIRKIVARYMNKMQDDFATAEEYNDYLELVESLTFDLLSENNVQRVYVQLERFRRENKDIVERNLQRQMRETESIRECLELESERKRKIREADVQELEQEARQRDKEQKAMIDELACSDQPASLLLAKKETASRTRSFGRGQPTDVLLEDPLESCHVPVPVRLQEPCFDPMLEHWVSTVSLKGSGSSPILFHTKAIQSLYLGLFMHQLPIYPNNGNIYLDSRPAQ